MAINSYDRMLGNIKWAAQQWGDALNVMEDKKNLEQFAQTIEEAEWMDEKKRKFYADAIRSGKGGIATQMDFANKPEYDPFKLYTKAVIENDTHMQNLMTKVLDFQAAQRKKGSGSGSGGDKLKAVKTPYASYAASIMPDMGNEYKAWSNFEEVQMRLAQNDNFTHDPQFYKTTAALIVNSAQKNKGEGKNIAMAIHSELSGIPGEANYDVQYISKNEQQLKRKMSPWVIEQIASQPQVMSKKTIDKAKAIPTVEEE